MKLEQIVNTPRLEREMEVPEHFEAATLKEKNEMLLEKIKWLEGQYNVVSGRLSGVERAYGHAEEQLENFKEVKEDFEDVIEENKEKLAEKGVEDKIDVIEDNQLNKAEEVSAYKAAGRGLRRVVGSLKQQKEWTMEAYDTFGGELNFKADSREESFEAMRNKLQEISGSIEMLKLERQDVVEALSREAAKFLGKKFPINTLDRVSRSMNSVMSGSANISGKGMWSPELADAVSEYGIEVVAKAIRKFGEDPETFFYEREKELERDKERILGTRALFAVSELYSQMAKDPSVVEAHRHAEKIEQEKKLAEETLIEIQKAKLEYDCDNLLNIEEEKPNAREGEMVFYKIWWEPRIETNILNKSKKEVRDEKAELESQLEELQSKKPFLFQSAWKKKVEELKTNIETFTKDESRLKKGATEALDREGYPHREKINLPFFPNAKMRDAINGNTYTHDNYGRGYWGARSQQPLKTIGDFLDYSEEVCKEVINQKLTPEEEKLIKRFPDLSKIIQDHFKYSDEVKSVGKYTVRN